MNKQKQSEWYAKRLEAIVWLRETFPLVFTSNIKPLKVGIRQDILALNKEGMPGEKWIGYAIRNYVNAHTYLKLMKPGAQRFNLQGMPEGEVNKEDAERAKMALDVNKKKMVANCKKLKTERLMLREGAKKEVAIVVPAILEIPANTNGKKILTLKKKIPETLHG